MMDRPEPRLIHFTWRSSYGPDGPHKNHFITAIFADSETVYEWEYIGYSCAEIRKKLLTELIP